MEVVDKALALEAERLADRQALAAELAALATDPDDRAEMLAVTDLIEILLVPR